MHKHAKPLQWLTFWPYFLVRYVFVVVAKSLYRGDVKSARSTLAGIIAFWHMRRHPDSGELPEELMRTTRAPAENAVIGQLGIDTDR